jgi:hypothetical protein
MRYLIALLCPPLAILMCGHFFLFLISIPLCIIYFPAALLALLVVAAYYETHSLDRYMEQALKIESGYLKILKSHLRVVNRSIKEDTKMARLERKLREDGAKAAAAPATPREPWITWQGVRSAAVITWQGTRSGRNGCPDEAIGRQGV